VPVENFFFFVIAGCYCRALLRDVIGNPEIGDAEIGDPEIGDP
jgi:hypothetical protein